MTIPLLGFFVVAALNLILNLFTFSRLLHLTLCLTSPPVCACIYTVGLVVLSITDEDNGRLLKRLRREISFIVS